METIDELTSFLTSATADGVFGRLLFRGEARSLMRENGVLAHGAPRFAATIDTDLAEHGFALLRGAMAMRVQAGASDLTNRAFERAANAFEALVRNGDPTAHDRGFFRTLAAAAYHLAGFSAVAFSLFNETDDDLNLTPGETAVRYLILRDLDRLRAFVRRWLDDIFHSDDYIAGSLTGGDIETDEVFSTVLNTTICRALAFFDLSLAAGEEEPVEQAIGLLSTAVDLANTVGNVPLWWISNLCCHLIGDLWQHSLHQTLPVEPPEGAGARYSDLRRLFISSLYARKVSEVELWPSQREAAQRSTNMSDDLVVALPTSSGKTRVAEIAALMTLAAGRRVLIVTPLRALSAQTERSFRRTFGPLGFSISSLYGSTGVLGGDEATLRTHDIIVATPEKLDFALRRDASLINDVGLVVLDEGHMIGPSEREIRYETLVQRLLRRNDATDRRVICLSAILPSGEELDDLTAWIRSGDTGGAVRSDWRPTRQRFGALTWHYDHAQLRLDLDDNGPFINRFVVAKTALGQERKPYPRENKHLTLFAAWEFARQGKRTLIFSTQANWVEGYGEQVVELCRRGYLPSLLDDQAPITRALEIGKEWLGEDHPAVASLKVGVAIHHGRLPSPFLRELEALLSDNVLSVIVSSPTLSQGLNLNAGVLLVPTLVRSGAKISGEELSNVAGRAGRAFVDAEGLIVHVMFDRLNWRKREWSELVDAARDRSLKSGLIQIVAQILERIASRGVFARDDAWEYLANARQAWLEPEEEHSTPGPPLSELVERLDATVFGLIDALDAESSELPRLLDEALNGSLWALQLSRGSESEAAEHRKLLRARANVIWQSTTAEARRGHFAMGVGLEAGLAIDAMAIELADLLDQADSAALSGDVDQLVDALEGLGERLLFTRPFTPDSRNSLPSNWKLLLRAWVSGEDVSNLGSQSLGVISKAFAYRLVWGLEAIRSRRLSLGWSPEVTVGGAAAVVETGVPQVMMAMLIRAGLPSRRAARLAIEGAQSSFVTTAEMRGWLESDEVSTHTEAGNWPTPDTAELWVHFRTEALRGTVQEWTTQRYESRLDTEASPPAGVYRIEIDEVEGRTWLATPDFKRVAPISEPAAGPRTGVLTGRLSGDSVLVDTLQVGPETLDPPRVDS